LTEKNNCVTFHFQFQQSINIISFPEQKYSISMTKFTHLDEKNKSRMVDITAKEPTVREARARGKVLLRRDSKR
jgi:hypothetical protein